MKRNVTQLQVKMLTLSAVNLRPNTFVHFFRLAFNVNDMVVCIDIDLNSFESIRDVVKKLENEANTITELDVLIHNDYALPKRFGKDTSKFTMMVNYYGPWLLTHLLMEKLKAAARIREKARIIIVSSNYHKYGRPTIKLDFLKPAFWKYFDAKSGLILFTMELDRRLKGSGVTVNAVHPGAANKPQLHNQTPIICLATTTQFATTSGNYFNECTVKSLSGYYSNLDRAEKFWTSTAKYVGLKDAENILPSNKGST